MYRVTSQQQNEYVLGDLAYGTGGTFFHNSNDLQAGLQLAGLAPEVSYVLAFSPQNRKMNGQYHLLRVDLAKKLKYSVQARRGYYSPRKVDDPHELARQEIQEAIYSQEEINELPLDLQTQYFKNDPEGARLSVVSRLELKNMHFRKARWPQLGRSHRWQPRSSMKTAISSTGGEKTVQMRLKDATYDRLTPHRPHRENPALPSRARALSGPPGGSRFRRLADGRAQRRGGNSVLGEAIMATQLTNWTKYQVPLALAFLVLRRYSLASARAKSRA